MHVRCQATCICKLPANAVALQVGASNELPESEELDALYDRFLLRRRVGQVTAGSIADMLQVASEVNAEGLGMGEVAKTITDVALSREEFRSVRCAAACRDAGMTCSTALQN